MSTAMILCFIIQLLVNLKKNKQNYFLSLKFNNKAGWMMYNWLISSLALGTTIVLYDGSPILPKIDFLWTLIDQLK